MTPQDDFAQPANTTQEEENENSTEIATVSTELESTDKLPKRDCNEKERLFAQFRVAGKTLAEAYNLAGWNANNDNSASVSGHAIEQRPQVQLYKKELLTAKWQANQLSMAERRNILAEIARTTASNATRDSVAVEISFNNEGDEILKPPKISDKLKALELDAKLSGELTNDINVDARQIHFQRFDE